MAAPPRVAAPGRPAGVFELLAQQAAARPDAPFLLTEGRQLSYGQVHAQADALAAAWHALGLEAGDRIALTLPAGPEFVVTVFAAARLGAAIVPLDPHATAPELQYLLRHSEAAAVVTAERVDDIDLLERYEAFWGRTPQLHYVVAVGEQDLWYDDRVYQFADLVSSGAGRGCPQPPGASRERLFAIVYTSGTQGKPKGVALTQGNLVATATATAALLELGPDDVVAGLTSLVHAFGLGPGLLGTAWAGGAVVLQADDDPGRTLDLLERFGVTVHHGTPTSLIRLLRHPSWPRRGLHVRTGIAAGAPLPETWAERVRRELVPDLRVAYSLTEAGSVVAMTRADDPPGKRRQTVGRPLPGVEVRVLDEDGAPLPVESVGEIAVRGPGVMRGYHRQPQETARSFTPDGFFRTGDVGMIDEEGYLHLLGHRQERILRGGTCIHPREIEDRLRAHPAVLDAVVVGVPDEELGERVYACVMPVEGAVVTGEEILDFCRAGLAPAKVPDQVRFWDRFPMTGSGKVRRVELARALRAELFGREGANRP